MPTKQTFDRFCDSVVFVQAECRILKIFAHLPYADEADIAAHLCGILILRKLSGNIFECSTCFYQLVKAVGLCFFGIVILVLGIFTDKNMSNFCPLPLGRNRFKVEFLISFFHFIWCLVLNRTMRSKAVIFQPPLLNLFIQFIQSFKPV
jgi:hypothetical protein